MKLVQLLAVLSLSLTLYTANAENMDFVEDDYLTYCTEQAIESGIEDANEKSEYIKECLESFMTPAEDSAPQE